MNNPNPPLTAERLAEFRDLQVDSTAGDAPYNPDVWTLDAARRELVAEVDRLRAQVADYENRITWHTTCGDCAGHLDREYAADRRAAQAAEQLAAVWALVEEWRGAGISSAAMRDLVTGLLAIRDQEQDGGERQASTYLVWSNEQRTWRGPNGSGYTGDIWAAGRYDETEAAKACGLRTWSQGSPPPEVMVLAPEHGRDALTLDDIRAAPDLMRDRIAEATRDAIAAREASRG
ncbi:hypothetical protein [Streptosporangium sp. V21-05]|uniref:hypothetical protein n=1 Tax=Streptosporangium sp. V21-05 TaxID=3446115 RepID=UPI003F53D998